MLLNAYSKATAGLWRYSKKSGEMHSARKCAKCISPDYFCKQYLNDVHNFTAADKKSLRALRKYYKKNIYHRDFNECIYARTLLKKGRVKPKMILPLPAKRMTSLSHMIEVMQDHVLVFTLHSQALTKSEKWIQK